MEKVTLYICCSHLYVPYVLTLFQNNGSCYVYTDKEDINDFFTHLGYPIGVIYDKYAHGPLFLRPLADRVRKLYLSRWFRRKQFSDVYFFHEGYCEAANWLMLKMKKNNTSVFHYLPVARTETFDTIIQDKGWKSRIFSFYCMITWGYIPIYSTKGDQCSIMPVGFYKKLGITKEEKLVVNKDIAKLLLSEPDFPSFSIVLLSNPNIKSEQQKKDYSSFLEMAFRPIMKSTNILFKNHPGRDSKIGLEKDLKEIPSYISGNLLTQRFRCFIGVNSALLCEAANDGTLSICLADLVIKDNNTREAIVSYQKSLSDKIIYPKTINDLWTLIA